MTYTVRITGPSIDHVALVTSIEDVDAARAVLDKIERELFPPTYFKPDSSGKCINCGEGAHRHEFGGMCFAAQRSVKPGHVQDAESYVIGAHKVEKL